MKESHSEELAIRADPELYAGVGNIAGVATTGARAGQVLSSEKRLESCADPFRIARRQHRSPRNGELRTNTAESQTLCMYGTSKHENRAAIGGFIPAVPVLWASCQHDPPRSSGGNGQSTSLTGMLP